MSVKPSKQALRAVSFARAQLGKPYVWGAAGPSSFDCSGLTSDSYAHAGVSITRTTYSQWAQPYPKVLRNEIIAGDLIFSYPNEGGIPGPGHVAIAVSPSQCIQAPHTGAFVEVVPIAVFDSVWVGANRPSPGAPRTTWHVKNGKGDTLGHTAHPVSWALKHPRSFRRWERVWFERD